MAVKDLVFTVLGIDKASKTFDDVGDSMDRMARRGDKSMVSMDQASKVGAKSMAAMLAASLVASTGIAAALAGVPVLFAGMAAAALSQNAEVANSFRDLGLSMKTGLVADAGVLEDEMVGVATDINTAFQDLRPQLREAFTAAGPHIDNLVDGLTGFAREAMPGMVTAVMSAGPVMQGLENLLVSTGRGFGEFLSVVSSGAPEAGDALTDFGELVEGVLPNVGEMLLNLTDLWAEHGDQAVRVITGITGVVSDLSSSALPTLSDGLGVALDVLEGVLGVIEPMSGVLGPLIGMWLSLSLAMKGLGAVRGIVDSVGSSIGSMRENFAKSPTAVGKLTSAVGGAMGMLGGPWGIAVAGATAVLALFGQESQENAADQRSLAGALKESGGAFDEQARKILFNSEAYQDVQDAVKRAGLTHKEFLDAIIEGGSAYDDLISDLQGLTQETTKHENRTRQGRYEMTEQGKAAHELLGQTKGLREMVAGAIEDFQREQEAVGGVAQSMVGARPGADSLAEAISVLGNKTATAAEHADALNTAWRELQGIDLTLEEALAAFEGGLDGVGTAMEGVREKVANWQTALVAADGQVDVSTEAGRQLSANLIGVGEDYKALAQTAYDTTYQRTQSEWLATTAAVAAATQRRAQFIAEATQMGFNQEQAVLLANRYLGLPDDIMTWIQADASNAQGTIDGFVNKNNGRTINIAVTSSFVQAKGGMGGKLFEGFAAGGHVSGREPIRVGEEGEEIFVPDGPGTIIPHGPTKRFLASLRAGAGAQARSSADRFETAPVGSVRMESRDSALSRGGDDERIVRLFTQALERVTVNLDGRMVGIMQGRQAGLLGRTG